MNPAALDQALMQYQSRQQELARKKAIAQRFGEAAQVYDDKVIVQKRVSKRAFELLQEFLTPSTRKQLALDIGCGTGSDTDKLLQFSHRAVGMDLSEGMICWAKQHNDQQKLNWLVADAESLPCKSGSIDIVYSSMALQWLEDVNVVASECFRVISKGGAGHHCGGA